MQPDDRSPPHPPQVTGYRVGPPVGRGPHGPAWTATGDDGTSAVVSVLPVPAGERGTVVLRRLRELVRTPHPHLARVLQVRACAPDRCAVVTAAITAPSLQEVLDAHGPLPREQVDALGRALGGALHHLHRRGVVHGNVTPASVLLTAAGPVLVDLTGPGGGSGARAPEQVAGARGTAAGDVWALARLLRSCAPGDAALAAALAPALAPDPRHRPGASWFARLAPPEAAAGQPPPTTRALGQPPPTTPAPGRRRRRLARRWAAGALTVLVSAGVSGAVTAGLLRPPGLEETVSALVAARDRALVAGDPAMLAAVTVPGSAAARADAALLARLEAAGTRPSRLRTEVTAVRVLRRDAHEAQAEVTLRQGPSERTGPGGGVARLPAQPARCVRLTLAGPDPWAVRATAPCPTG